MGKSLIALAIMLNIAAASLLAAEFRFTSGGKAAYVVAKPENARPTEARAASELAYYLNIITDVEFQIVEENAVPEGQ